MQIHTLVHELSWPVHESVVALKGLLDGEHEDYVDKDHAVGRDQVQHLERLGVPQILAVLDAVHSFDQHVAPDIQTEHARKDHRRVEEPGVEGA